MKSYTDINQSRKLTEILPLESADMDYIPIVNIDGEYSITVNEWDNDHITEEGWIPCWSLAALLNVLPPIYNLKPILDLEENSIQYSGIDIYVKADNPVDACYEVILKLHELKKL